MTFRGIAFVAFLVLASCNHDRSLEIDMAMNHYDRLIEKMDADSIANLYTDDGQMGKGVIGRDSIRAFLKSFKDAHVLNNKSLTTSFLFQGDSAHCEGTYTQKVVVKADTLNVKGKYSVTWVKPDKKWLIKRMTTKPE